MKGVLRVYIGILILGWAGLGCKTKQTSVDSSANSTSATQKFAVKYSAILGIPVPENAHQALYSMVADWLATPYKYGGNTKEGIDCSGLTLQIFKQVFAVDIPRTSADIHKFAKPIARTELKQADLIFFKIKSSKVSHVGVHLNSEYFVHASTSKGVIINRLTESYYSTYFYSCGRITIPGFTPR